MRRRQIPIICLLCIAMAGMAFGESKIERLVRKADMVTRSKTSATVFEMQVKTKSYTRSFKIVAWDDRQKEEKTLIKILGPALWRGYGTLKIDTRLKMFNPKSNHVTVVGSSMLGDAWMGSHFTNDDLVKETQLHKHFKARIVKQWSGDHGGLTGGTFYHLQLDPKPSAPVAWGKIVYKLWEKGEVVLPVSATYFRKEKDEKPQRTMTFTDVKKMGGRMMPSTMMVTVLRKPGEFTKIVYRKIKFDIRIPSSKFTEQALRR